jgi:hypothetical protein
MYLRLNSFTSPGGDLVPGLDFLFKRLKLQVAEVVLRCYDNCLNNCSLLGGVQS